MIGALVYRLSVRAKALSAELTKRGYATPIPSRSGALEEALIKAEIFLPGVLI